MKTLIFAIALIAITFTACQKAPITIPTKETSSDVLPTNAHYYCNGIQVYHQHDITNFGLPQTSVLLTDQLDGVMDYYYFDNNDMAESFINSVPTFTEMQAKIRQAKIVRAYAVSIHEDEYVATNGVPSVAFTTYLDDFKTRAFPINLYSLINYLPAPGYPVMGPTPVLVGGINNLSNSVRGTGAPMNLHFFDANNFNPIAGVFFAVVGGIPNLPLMGWGNRISSVNF